MFRLAGSLVIPTSAVHGKFTLIFAPATMRSEYLWKLCVCVLCSIQMSIKTRREEGFKLVARREIFFNEPSSLLRAMFTTVY